MKFLELRNAPNALKEIRWCAERAEEIWADLMPVTHAAFVANGRICP